MKVLNHLFKIKPLSANRTLGARGKKSFKSQVYVQYQKEIAELLKEVRWPFGVNQVTFEVEGGFSNRGADLDNIIKPILDTYQGIFEDFNDNRVYKIKLTKRITPKGDEYIRVRVYEEPEQEE